jgi:hypothetical protein
MDQTNALATREERRAIVRGTTGNAALGAGLGALAGFSFAVIQFAFSRYAIDVMIVFTLGGSLLVALIAAGLTLYANSHKRRHKAIHTKLQRAADLRREELITPQDYAQLKRELLATYAGRPALPKALHTAKLTGAASISIITLLLAAMEVSNGSPILLSMTGIGAVIGAVLVLILSVTYYVVMLRVVEGEGAEQLPAPNHNQLNAGETTYEPLG